MLTICIFDSSIIKFRLFLIANDVVLYRMADSSRKFINNQDINEQNSFTHLLESINPESEEEINPINH